MCKKYFRSKKQAAYIAQARVEARSRWNGVVQTDGEGLWATSFSSSLPILWVTYASQVRWGLHHAPDLLGHLLHRGQAVCDWGCVAGAQVQGLSGCPVEAPIIPTSFPIFPLGHP